MERVHSDTSTDDREDEDEEEEQEEEEEEEEDDDDESTVSSKSASSNRQMRNIAEKLRRDKLNMHISELASIVPMVSSASKRIDKTSVLRLSAAYLRIYQNLLTNNSDGKEWRPYFLKKDDLGGLLLEAVNGFLLVIATSSGKVIYVSDGIEKILGHLPIDVLGHSIYNILHSDDHSLMQQHLQCSDEDENRRRSFYCRLSERSLSRSDCSRYDLVHILGHIRSVEQLNHHIDAETSLVRENLLVSIVRLLRNEPIAEISWMAGHCDQYITHHALDGRIICADHRISLITGHLPEEVVGKSAYDYIFFKDIPVAAVSHREIFTSNSGTSRAVYRLQSRTGKLIYLKSQGVLQFDPVTHKVESFLCINKLLSEDDGRLALHEVQIRFKPTVNHPTNCNGSCSFLEVGGSDACDSTTTSPAAPSRAHRCAEGGEACASPEESETEQSGLPKSLLAELLVLQENLRKRVSTISSSSPFNSVRERSLVSSSSFTGVPTAESSSGELAVSARVPSEPPDVVPTTSNGYEHAQTNGKGSPPCPTSDKSKGLRRRFPPKRTYGSSKILAMSVPNHKTSVASEYYGCAVAKKPFFQGKQPTVDAKVVITPKRKRGRPRKRPESPPVELPQS